MSVIKKIYISLVIVFCITAWAFAHGWMAPKKEAQKKNPVKNSREAIQLGKNIYTEFCTNCHGKDAKGKDSGAAGIKTRPTDLQKTIKAHSDGDFFWKINTGRGDMPSFEKDLEEKEIWSIIHYLRELGQSSEP